MKTYYPPRPEHRIKPESLMRFDTGEYMAQPKFNGSCGVLITGENGEYQLLDRSHDGVQKPLTMIGKLDLTPLAKAHPDSVFIGEYMNKYKLNEAGEKWIDKFIIFDVLKQKGDSFVGYTTRQRREFLIAVFGNMETYVNEKGDLNTRVCTHPYCFPTDFDGVYLIRSYYGNFFDRYHELTKIDLIEGLVLKKLEAQLEPAYTEKNNQLWQLKVRKPTKNYDF